MHRDCRVSVQGRSSDRFPGNTTTAIHLIPRLRSPVTDQVNADNLHHEQFISSVIVTAVIDMDPHPLMLPTANLKLPIRYAGTGVALAFDGRR